MKVHKLGGEETAEVAVVYQIHGDEVAGLKAFEELSEDLEFQKPVKFIQANVAAAKEGERYLDADLNRCFPGEPLSDVYEERVAYRMVEELEGKTLLDIHSSNSEPLPFVIVQDPEMLDSEAVRSLGVKKVVDFSKLSSSRIPGATRIAVECGKPDSRKAVERAKKFIKRFLKKQEVIEGASKQSQYDFYQVYDSVEGSGYEFVAENFKRVKEGEVFARKTGDKMTASEDFYPVLMSTEGYDDMVGFKARKLD